MTETAAEPVTEPTGETPEEEEPITDPAAPDLGEDGDAEEPETGDITEPASEGPDAPEEQELEPGNPSLEAQKAQADETYQRLETKAKNYSKGLIEILADVPVPLTMCEMCADAYPGVRWLEPRDEEHAQLVAVVSGGITVENLEPDPDARECPTCKGKGGVKLPSLVPGNEVRTCRQCNGAGYVELNPSSGAPEAPAPPAENGQPEVYAGVPTEDSAVADMIARGYTIIPPMPRLAPPEE